MYCVVIVIQTHGTLPKLFFIPRLNQKTKRGKIKFWTLIFIDIMTRMSSWHTLDKSSYSKPMGSSLVIWVSLLLLFISSSIFILLFLTDWWYISINYMYKINKYRMHAIDIIGTMTTCNKNCIGTYAIVEDMMTSNYAWVMQMLQSNRWESWALECLINVVVQSS